MNKRPYDNDRDRAQSYKKPKHDNGQSHRGHARPQHRDDRESHGSQQKSSKPSLSHDEALAKLPPPTTQPGPIPHYTPFTVPTGLPSLPDVNDTALASAPFRHKSTANYNRSSNPNDVTYEKLEFLGDAYLELLASRLLYSRFPHLLAGQQSQLRELLVKNETLAEYARAYGFDKKVQVGDMERMMQDTKDRGNKGFNKVLGDVFEAYVASVVLSDPEDGFAVAEKWMTALWAPKLLDAAQKERYYTPSLDLQHSASASVDVGEVYNPTAKAELQKRILAGPGVKLEYEPYASSVELKGDQLGQNRHFIAVYLTGYGYERKVLGQGEGRNKVEAGNWAAGRAMFGESKALVEECEEKLKAIREEKRKEKEAKEAAENGEKKG